MSVKYLFRLVNITSIGVARFENLYLKFELGVFSQFFLKIPGTCMTYVHFPMKRHIALDAAKGGFSHKLHKFNEFFPRRNRMKQKCTDKGQRLLKKITKTFLISCLTSFSKNSFN